MTSSVVAQPDDIAPPLDGEAVTPNNNCSGTLLIGTIALTAGWRLIQQWWKS